MKENCHKVRNYKYTLKLIKFPAMQENWRGKSRPRNFLGKF